MDGGKKTEVKAELFQVKTPEYKMPELHHHTLEDAFDEIEILGFALCSPFNLLKRNFPHLNKQKAPVHYTSSFVAEPTTVKNIRVKELEKYIGKEVELTGYLVTIKPTRTVKGESMAFGCFIDEEGFFFDTTHFPKIAKQFPFRGRGIYTVRGRVDVEFDFCSITVTYMGKLETIGVEDLTV